MNLIIFILVVYGTSNIVVREYIFEWFRKLLEDYEFFWQLFNCMTCAGFWFGIVFSFLLPYNFFLCGLIGSAVCNILEKLKNKF